LLEAVETISPRLVHDPEVPVGLVARKMAEWLEPKVEAL
jgi:hypothetical protein